MEIYYFVIFELTEVKGMLFFAGSSVLYDQVPIIFLTKFSQYRYQRSLDILILRIHTKL